MSNEQKTPLSRTLPRLARKSAIDEIARRGLSIPGKVVSRTGYIVTVQFLLTGTGKGIPNITMPLAYPQYIALPIQPGDTGLACPASVFLGGISGLGQGNGDLSLQEGNLSTLYWLPIGSKGWAPASDPNAVTLTGVGSSGVTLKTGTGNASITLTDTAVTMVCAGKTVTLNASGFTIDGVLFETHAHLPGTLNVGGTAVTGDTGAHT